MTVREWKLLRQGWLWALLAAFAAATIAIAVGSAPGVASWSTQAASSLVFTWLSWRLSVDGRRRPASRRFWRAATVSGVIFTISSLLRAVDVVVEPTRNSAVWTAPSALLTIGSAWLLYFMLGPLPPDRGRERRGLWLEAGCVLVAAAVFVWTVALSGALQAESHEQRAWTAIGAIIMLVSAFAVVRLLVTGEAPFTTPAGLAIGAAFTLHGLERALNPQVAGVDDLRAVLIARLVPPLLLAAAPCLERVGRKRPAGPPGRRARLFVPLAALAVTQVLLVGQLADEGFTVRSWAAAMGTVVIAGLIILRQDLLLIENARLVGQLDRSIDAVGQQERWFRSLVEHSSDVTLVLDPGGTVTYGTPALRPVLGQDPAAAVGRRAGQVVRPRDRRRFDRLLAPVLAGRADSRSFELEARRGDGAAVWLNVIATGRVADPAVGGVVLNVRDVTDTVTLRNRLRHDANHDPLTGLANRALFNERAEALHDPGARGQGTAVLLLDLDRFKEVNDRLGHQAGDDLLRVAARRLRRSVRPADTVARFGGDEFTVILADTTAPAAMATARRIVEVLGRPLSIGGRTMRPGASVGVAVSTDKPIEALLRDADEAMYEAKRRGSGTRLFHEPATR
ncbi:diguanylate cyclase domain-containing protein [Asanoa iriomotensis]|uniref:diguanylate cyclase domain-containing protein n=1 Tax=Asanoa iriomotensis TaxID=234613 RepID=UPI001941C929|nr:diguanylate cyclase [Asanoa iriomotensis]